MNLKQNIKRYIPDVLLDIKRRIEGAYPYRPYMDKYKCIFIHIPKTAGTSILMQLMGPSIKRDHKTADCFKVVNPEKFKKYYKFTFVRNPWDRVVSSYEYILNGTDNADNSYLKSLFEKKYNTFEKFVLEYLDKDSIHTHPLFKPQYRYIYDVEWNCMVDFVGRFENISEDFQTISKNIGIDGNLKKTNQSQRDSYQEYYSNKEVVDKISFLYSKDIELFNYEFDDESIK